VKYTETDVAGVMIVDIEPHADARGFFARLFCADEFARHGLDSHVAQMNMSFSRTCGTVRGLHRQVPPYAEAKLVRCIRGAIADFAVDVRPDSPTYRKHVMVELTPGSHRAVFVPPYVAHAFQTLVDDTEVLYQVSGPFAPTGEQGFRLNDPAFGIALPVPISVISDKDANWPLLDEVESTS
jgi:dTDP-4-dehydrorhamnose 3,5-epimerase